MQVEQRLVMGRGLTLTTPVLISVEGKLRETPFSPTSPILSEIGISYWLSLSPNIVLGLTAPVYKTFVPEGVPKVGLD